MLSVSFNERSEAVLTNETEMLARGIAYVRDRPLRVLRVHVGTKYETTWLVSTDDIEMRTGVYVELPDYAPEVEADRAYQTMRRLDVLNAMNSLEYIAGGGRI